MNDGGWTPTVAPVSGNTRLVGIQNGGEPSYSLKELTSFWVSVDHLLINSWMKKKSRIKPDNLFFFKRKSINSKQNHSLVFIHNLDQRAETSHMENRYNGTLRVM